MARRSIMVEPLSRGPPPVQVAPGCASMAVYAGKRYGGTSGYFLMVKACFQRLESPRIERFQIQRRVCLSTRSRIKRPVAAAWVKPRWP
jgi:hypothetical protein